MTISTAKRRHAGRPQNKVKPDRFVITLENSGGELARRTAKTDAECRAAVIDIASNLAYFAGGDIIRVVDRRED